MSARSLLSRTIDWLTILEVDGPPELTDEQLATLHAAYEHARFTRWDGRPLDPEGVPVPYQRRVGMMAHSRDLAWRICKEQAIP